MADIGRTDPQAQPTGRPKPVLIVDDEPPILDLLQDVLEEAGLEVVTATNGAAALALIQHTPVALVVTDMMMPKLSGIELARRLHSNPETGSIPLILMSAVTLQGPKEGFVAVIQKPFSVDTVVEIILQFLPA